jgi:nitroimidazol reductase NimA-like FMN-containing flavoprotein (pyridoxamine 5'-phosphate oxidase superfamily)
MIVFFDRDFCPDRGLMMVDTMTLKKTIEDVLKSRTVAVLSTQGEEYPHACLVAFAVSTDLTRIVFATSRTTRKYSNIRQNNRVSILVDTRTHNEEDFHRATVVTAQGRTEELHGSEAAMMEKLFLERHSYLETFIRAPTTVLMGMKVSSYAVVSRFQNVLVLDMDHGPNR